MMRTDLASMNPGKMCAQAAHAGNAVEQKFHDVMASNASKPTAGAAELNTAFHEWKNSTTQGFGVTIVLGANIEQIRTKVAILSQVGYLTEVIHDPSYPLRDGQVTHLLPLDTCAYVFVNDRDTDVFARAVMADLDLCP